MTSVPLADAILRRFAVSPVVAGFMLIILFGPQGLIGSWFEGQGIKIIYALPGMIIATLFVTLPFVAREVMPVLRESGLEQEEAAYVLGASRWPFSSSISFTVYICYYLSVIHFQLSCVR